MAEVIKGVFPATRKNDPPTKTEKEIPSYILHVAVAFSDPLIWRRIQVPGAYTLAQLHHVIQRSMGWSGSYLHQFLVGKISFEPTMDTTGLRESKRFDEGKYRLHTLEEGMRFMFTYFYNAGEGWEHEITLEEIVPAARPLDHAIVMAGERACPPEAIADIHEYHKILAARRIPGSEGEKRFFALAGPDFDPGLFDLEAAKKRLAAGV